MSVSETTLVTEWTWGPRELESRLWGSLGSLREGKQSNEHTCRHQSRKSFAEPKTLGVLVGGGCLEGGFEGIEELNVNLIIYSRIIRDIKHPCDG